MSDVDEAPGPERDSGPRFTWSCPHDGCKKYIACYTEKARRYLTEEHLQTHRKQLVDAGAMAGVIRTLLAKNPNELHLSLTDIGFLKSRGIKADDPDIFLDLGIEHKPSKTKISQQFWKEILENLWRKHTENT